MVSRVMGCRRIVLGAAFLTLMILAGCGEQKTPPVPPPAPAKADKSAASAAIAAADQPVTTVFACAKDKVFQLTAGDCPKCKAKLTEMKIANPDPGVCVVTGEKIEKHNSFGIAKEKAYAFCCDMCLQNLLDDPDGVVKKAQERADAAKGDKK
ncbi:MAG TPA: hypothetical protein VL860_07285 [Planctomycetota bacterium]|nr:hypothetical protein [Planctomycetota bacterium]